MELIDGKTYITTTGKPVVASIKTITPNEKYEISGVSVNIIEIFSTSILTFSDTSVTSIDIVGEKYEPDYSNAVHC